MAIENLGEVVHEIDPEIAPIIGHFDKILDIPRPSLGEARMRQYISAWARRMGLEPKLDNAGNLAIDIPATPGYESRPRMILQAHMDMITKGGNDKKPTRAFLKDGWIASDGTTTLGADNGLAIALMMALVEDPDVPHGPLTMLFTADEERGTTGAKDLDVQKLIPEDAVYLINLDSEEGAHLICRSAAAGEDVVGTFDISEKVDIPDGYKILEIKLSGLPSGHSGIDIHDKRGNAIQMLSSILAPLSHLSHLSHFQLVEFSGGTKRNDIPDQAKCKIAVPSGKVQTSRKFIENFIGSVRKNGYDLGGLSRKYSRAIQVVVNQISAEGVQALMDDIKDRIIKAIGELSSLPIVAEEGGYKGGVQTSSNLGVVDFPRDVDGNVTSESVLQFTTMVRAMTMANLDERVDGVVSALERGGASIAKGGRYSNWLEDEEAPAIQLLKRAIQEALPGVDPVTFIMHAGLECAPLKERITASPSHRSDLTVGATGAEIIGGHTIKERANLASLKDHYRVIKTMVGLPIAA